MPPLAQIFSTHRYFFMLSGFQNCKWDMPEKINTIKLAGGFWYIQKENTRRNASDCLDPNKGRS